MGIDVHKKSWKVTVMSDHHEHKTFSQDADPQTLASYLQRTFPGAEYKSVYEAGFSGFWTSKQLKTLGIDNMIVNPADVPTMHKEQMQKSDVVDSRKLARSLRSGQLQGIYEPDDLTLSVRQYIRNRSQLVKDIAREKNRLKSFFHFIGQKIPEQFSSNETRHFSKRYINWLENLKFDQIAHQHTVASKVRQIKSMRGELLLVNRQIKEISKDEQFQDDVNLLCSIPGIGLISAMIILTEIAPMERFTSSEELNSYVGLVPKVHGSGEKESVGKLTSRGNDRLKNMIIECSWVLVRKDPAMLLKYEELIKHMKKNKAIIRIARSLLNRIRRVLIKKEKYQKGVYGK